MSDPGEDAAHAEAEAIDRPRASVESVVPAILTVVWVAAVLWLLVIVLERL